MNFTSTSINLSTTSIPNTTANPAKGPVLPNQHRSQATVIVQVILLAILGVVIVLGNLASIVTFLKTQSLRRRCHYLLINLSVADFLVGINNYMTMYFFLTGPQFNLFIVVLEFVDTLTGTASILTLSMIALERFYAIYFPFKHRTLRLTFYIISITIPWFLALVQSCLYLVVHFGQNSVVLQVYTHKFFVIAWLALVVITASYVSIGLKIRQQNPGAQNVNRAEKERKLAVTLLIVTLASLVTWIPFQCFVFVLYICKGCPFPHINVLFIMKFLQFCNSGINVFIYIIRMPEFRAAFWKLLCKDLDRVKVCSSNRNTTCNKSTILIMKNSLNNYSIQSESKNQQDTVHKLHETTDTNKENIEDEQVKTSETGWTNDGFGDESEDTKL